MTGVRPADSPYRHYTASEIAAANDTDLPKLLSSLGYHVKPIGRFHTTVEMDSIRIKNRRTWFRYSESVGGDAVAFLRHFHGMSFPEAVSYLLAFNAYPQLTQRSRPPPERERPPFVLPPHNSGNERVCAYLRQRCIGSGVIDSFIKAGLLYEDSQYHDCIFVGYDRDKKPVFAARRSTRGSFKGDVAGSDKRIAFPLPCDSGIDRVHVFESPIDLMSWITLYGNTNAVALCGLHDASLETYLDENPHIKRIVLCLDADAHGCDAGAKLGAKYRELGYGTQEQIPLSGKDWNEYLQIQIKGGP